MTSTETTRPEPQPELPISYTAMINPISGAGHALRQWRPIAEALTARGIEVNEVKTLGREHAVQAATEAAATGATVIAVGGDGMARDVATGVFAHTDTHPASHARLALIPAGRGNDLARKLGLPLPPHGPHDADAYADILAAGRTRKIDVLEAAGQIVLGNVYCGVDSLASEAINKRRNLPSVLVYRLAPVGSILRWSAPEFTLTTGAAESATARYHTVIVANSGRYGAGLDVVPHAELDSGRLEVLTVGNSNRIKVATFIQKAKTGRHMGQKAVESRPAQKITIDADRSVPVCADGDYLCEMPVTVRVRPAALSFVVP